MENDYGYIILIIAILVSSIAFLPWDKEKYSEEWGYFKKDIKSFWKKPMNPIGLPIASVVTIILFFVFFISLFIDYDENKIESNSNSGGDRCPLCNSILLNGGIIYANEAFPVCSACYKSLKDDGEIMILRISQGEGA